MTSHHNNINKNDNSAKQYNRQSVTVNVKVPHYYKPSRRHHAPSDETHNFSQPAPISNNIVTQAPPQASPNVYPLIQTDIPNNPQSPAPPAFDTQATNLSRSIESWRNNIQAHNDVANMQSAFSQMSIPNSPTQQLVHPPQPEEVMNSVSNPHTQEDVHMPEAQAHAQQQQQPQLIEPAPTNHEIVGQPEHHVIPHQIHVNQIPPIIQEPQSPYTGLLPLEHNRPNFFNNQYEMPRMFSNRLFEPERERERSPPRQRQPQIEAPPHQLPAQDNLRNLLQLPAPELEENNEVQMLDEPQNYNREEDYVFDLPEIPEGLNQNARIVIESHRQALRGLERIHNIAKSGIKNRERDDARARMKEMAREYNEPVGRYTSTLYGRLKQIINARMGEIQGN